MKIRNQPMKNKLLQALALAGTLALLIATPVSAAVVPVTTAFYSDALQSGITSSATSFSLVNGKDSQGNSLSGTYGFVIDQGSAVQEIVYCTNVVGTAVAGCSRGIDLTTGTTSVAALQQVHNRGASVQITTAPLFEIIANILRGIESIAQPIQYASTIATTTLAANGSNLIDWAVLRDTAISGSGAIAATNNSVGYVQIANGPQAAASTANNGSGAFLALPSSISTSTYQTNTASNKILLTGTNGHLDPNFIATTTGAASSSVPMLDGSGNPTWNLPMDQVIFMNANTGKSTSNTSTTTLFTVPIPANTLNGVSNILRITTSWVQVAGAGGTSYCGYNMDYGNGSSIGTTTNIGMASNSNGGNGTPSQIIVNFSATSTSSFTENSIGSAGQNGLAIRNVASTTDLTQKNYIAFNASGNAGAGTCALDSVLIEVLHQ